jgi:hypothetical protein
VEPTIRFRSSREICATHGPTIIRICDGVRTEIEDLIRVNALFDEQLEEWPAIGMLLVFTHETPLPTATTQHFAVDTMRRYSDKLVIAVALLGLGFWASAFRTCVSGVVRVLRGGSVAIEGSADAAITRLSTELIGIDPEALRQAYLHLWTSLERDRLAS